MFYKKEASSFEGAFSCRESGIVNREKLKTET
jgi:hypothetical protein